MLRGEKPEDFTLKVCGQEEYLLTDLPLIQAYYIQECISKDVTQILIIVSLKNIQIKKIDNHNKLNNDIINQTNRPSFSTLTLRKKGKHTCVWSIEEKFSFDVNGISRLNCDAAHRTVEVCILNKYNNCIIIIYYLKNQLS